MKKTSKFIREYGMTCEQIARKHDVSTTFIWILDRVGELHQFIAEQETKKKKLEKEESPCK
jgi:hypothetical protein